MLALISNKGGLLRGMVNVGINLPSRSQFKFPILTQANNNPKAIVKTEN
jgi:hypothetical protein